MGSSVLSQPGLLAPPGTTPGTVLAQPGTTSNGIAAPQILNPYTAQTAQDATQASQMSNAQQQQFLSQLAAQNGAGNQSSAFNQLQGIANGTGPNPAQAQLAQATGANTANQAALMAGQRGAGSNAGLIARQAAMQGGANQQNAAGQAASLQAQQQLGAINQMGGIAGQQVGQQQAALGQLQGANLAQQNAQLGALQGANQTAANLYGTGLGNQTQQYGINQGALNNQYATALGNQTQQYGINQGAQTQQYGIQQGANTAQQQSSNALIGGIVGGLGSAAAAGAKMMAHGGEVKLAGHGPKSYLGRSINPNMIHEHTVALSGGGKVSAMVSSGEVYLPEADAQAAAEGKVDPLEVGQKIPGKAPVKGDSPKNDIIPATLEEGGCVIPRSVLDSKNPHEAAARFVAEHLSKKGKK